MQFNNVLPLEGKACMCPLKRGDEGSMCERLKVSIMHERASWRMV